METNCLFHTSHIFLRTKTLLVGLNIIEKTKVSHSFPLSSFEGQSFGLSLMLNLQFYVRENEWLKVAKTI
jgi:hypothetical protein